MAPALTCHEFLYFLCRYVRGELEGPALKTFHAHLADCPECVASINDPHLLVHLAHLSHRDPMVPLAGKVPPALIVAVQASRALSCC